MPAGRSLEYEVAQLRKKIKNGKDLTEHDKLMIEYRLLQIEYGFDNEGEASKELAAWTKVLGPKRMLEIEKEIKEKNRLATKNNKPAFGWKGLVQ